MLSTGSHKCRARVLSLCLCLLLLSGPSWARRVQRLLADFPKKGQQSEKKKTKQKQKQQNMKMGKEKFKLCRQQQKSSSLCQEQQNIYRHISFICICIYRTVQHMLLSAMENIFLFMKTKRGVAQQSKHTFLST